jgi:predicted naringenin-chalcone synthase
MHVLATDEAILPESSGSMRWVLGDHGMHMSLARDVPERIAGPLRAFVAGLYERAGLSISRTLSETTFAIHPGGPKIIDHVAGVLELAAAQVQTSRDVLHDHGNMSSATLPHVWMRILADAAIPPGTLVASLAFGPGLTVCGGLFRKQ